MDDITKARIEWAKQFDEAVFIRYIESIKIITAALEDRITILEAFLQIKNIVIVPPFPKN